MTRVRLTLREGLLRYQNQVSILKKGYAQESYRIAAMLKSAIVDLFMDETQSPDIATYRDQRLAQKNPKTGKPLSTSTVRLELSLLSNVFDVGRIEWGSCSENPVKNVRKPKPPAGRDRRLTAREDRQILRYCNDHPTLDLLSIVILALETAMRQSEILGLRWEHINLRTGIAHLPSTKNGTKRDVPLNLKSRAALTRMGVKASGRVFSYTSNGLKSAWRIMTKRLNIEDLHFHDCRHEAASRMFELNRLDIMEIAAITGHKSLAMLKRYTHLKAANLVKKLDGNRSRGQQLIASHLVAYPGVAESVDGKHCVRLLDFEEVKGIGATPDEAYSAAQFALLTELMTSLRDRGKVTKPDQYLELVPEHAIVMVEPLPSAGFAA